MSCATGGPRGPCRGLESRTLSLSLFLSLGNKAGEAVIDQALDPSKQTRMFTYIHRFIATSPEIFCPCIYRNSEANFDSIFQQRIHLKNYFHVIDVFGCFTFLITGL